MNQDIVINHKGYTATVPRDLVAQLKEIHGIDVIAEIKAAMVLEAARDLPSPSKLERNSR